MKASKTLTSAIAAAAVVGAIGLAYAQTPYTTPQPATPADSSSPPVQNQGTTTSPSTMQTPASSTDTAAVQVERPAQADRN